jgi:hypothetical protein
LYNLELICTSIKALEGQGMLVDINKKITDECAMGDDVMKYLIIKP